jgi:hypothetical protein
MLSNHCSSYQLGGASSALGEVNLEPWVALSWPVFEFSMSAWPTSCAQLFQSLLFLPFCCYACTNCI